MRKLVLIAAASGMFGGTVGALVTAASQSQADPAAIVAAVQRVSDRQAEIYLQDLEFIFTRGPNAGTAYGHLLASEHTEFQQMLTALQSICEQGRTTVQDCS